MNLDNCQTNCFRCGAKIIFRSPSEMRKIKCHTEIVKCCYCGARTSFRNNDQIEWLSFSFENYEIVWMNFMKPQCEVHKIYTEDRAQMILSDLPWLPFDISLERLKILLTFS